VHIVQAPEIRRLLANGVSRVITAGDIIGGAWGFVGGVTVPIVPGIAAEVSVPNIVAVAETGRGCQPGTRIPILPLAAIDSTNWWAALQPLAPSG